MCRSGRHGLGWQAFEPSLDVSKDLCTDICCVFNSNVKCVADQSYGGRTRGRIATYVHARSSPCSSYPGASGHWTVKLYICTLLSYIQDPHPVSCVIATVVFFISNGVYWPFRSSRICHRQYGGF